MKSLNFKRKENAQLRYIEEQNSGKKKSQINWDRIVYLSILTLLVFFVLRYFFLSNFYISADGQVIFDNVELSQTEDIVIEHFFYNEGDIVKKGDSLFSYVIQENAIISSSVSEENTGDKSNWAEREMYALRKKIDLNNSKIYGDKKMLASFKSQLKGLENDVILGTANERDLVNLEYQINKIKTTIGLIQSENSVLGKQIITLQNNEASASSTNGTTEAYSPNRVFKSPIDGYISRIYKEPYEVAIKSQIILKIHQSDSVHIKGYFNQEDLRYVKEGDFVTVNFPDGKVSEGIIDRFYSSTVILPEEFQKKFEPVKRTIAVDVKPTEGSDLSLWKRYYKLSVKLTKRTF